VRRCVIDADTIRRRSHAKLYDAQDTLLDSDLDKTA